MIKVIEAAEKIDCEKNGLCSRDEKLCYRPGVRCLTKLADELRQSAASSVEAEGIAAQLQKLLDQRSGAEPHWSFTAEDANKALSDAVVALIRQSVGDKPCGHGCGVETDIAEEMMDCYQRGNVSIQSAAPSAPMVTEEMRNLAHKAFIESDGTTRTKLNAAIEAAVSVRGVGDSDTRKENDTLRRILANSNEPCVYCGLSKADMAKCKDGFPGCGRADDMQPIDVPAPSAQEGE